MEEAHWLTRVWHGVCRRAVQVGGAVRLACRWVRHRGCLATTLGDSGMKRCEGNRAYMECPRCGWQSRGIVFPDPRPAPAPVIRRTKRRKPKAPQVVALRERKKA